MIKFLLKEPTKIFDNITKVMTINGLTSLLFSTLLFFNIVENDFKNSEITSF
jgi:hypothetical protein